MRVESWFPEWNGMYWWFVKIQYTDRCSGVVEIRPRIPNKALEEDDEHTEAQYDVSRAIRIEFMNLWIGVGDLCDDEDGAKSWHKGNTFLFLERDGVHYVSVTYRVARFSSEENVLYYHSPVASNGTPFPFALTANWVYLPEANIRYPRSFYDAHPEFQYNANSLFYCEKVPTSHALSDYEEILISRYSWEKY